MHYVFISCQKWRKRRSWKPNYQKNCQKRRILHDFCRFNANTWAISNLASISLIAMFHIADREFSNGIPVVHLKYGTQKSKQISTQRYWSNIFINAQFTIYFCQCEIEQNSLFPLIDNTKLLGDNEISYCWICSLVQVVLSICI